MISRELQSITQARDFPTERTGSKSTFALPIVLVIAYLWSYWPTLLEMANCWRVDPNYSAGVFVVPLALMMAWGHRRVLADARVTSCWSGLIVLLLLLAMRAAGIVYGYRSLQFYSLLLTIPSLVLLVAGTQVCRQFVGVFAFLLLAAPLPARVHHAVALPLQEFAVRSAIVGLETTGWLVGREGNTIRLNDQDVVAVAEACSGLRMLTAFVIVATAMAIFIRRPTWQKVVLILSSIPIAVLANTLRLIATVVLFAKVGETAAQRFFHDFAGLTMMPLAVGALLFEAWLLKWMTDERSPSASPRGDARSGTTAGKQAAVHHIRGSTLLAASLVLVASGIADRVLAVHIAAALEKPHLLADHLASVPLEKGSWKGRDLPVDARIQETAGDDEYINRLYVDGRSGRAVTLYVGYLGRVRRWIVHRADICYPANGYEKLKQESITLADTQGKQVPALLYEFRPERLGASRVLVLDIYIANGRYLSDQDEANRFHGRDPGIVSGNSSYLTRIQFSMESLGDQQRDITLLTGFAETFINEIEKLMPDMQ